ncbi:hypothetical protein [Sphaerisporangium rhizosphaerae]|uniref:Uncharacterized protein n=1 Tax=Sphaerisporangium rhizosphaerae TaxID=2269375 RepID=A0ABW2PHB2_9ACTN
MTRQHGGRARMPGDLAMWLLAGACAAIVPVVASPAATADAGAGRASYRAHHARTQAQPRQRARSATRERGRARAHGHARAGGGGLARATGGGHPRGGDDGDGTAPKVVKSGNGTRNQSITEIGSTTVNKGMQHTTAETVSGTTGIQNALCKHAKVCNIHLKVIIINPGPSQKGKKAKSAVTDVTTTDDPADGATASQNTTADEDDCCCD